MLVALLTDIEDGAYEVTDLTTVDYRRIKELCDRYADADIGYVDAAVMAITERLDEPKLATLDHRHFRTLRPRHVDALRLLPEWPVAGPACRLRGELDNEGEAFTSAHAHALADIGMRLAPRSPQLAVKAHFADRIAWRDHSSQLADHRLRTGSQRPTPRAAHPEGGLRDLDDHGQTDDRESPRIGNHEDGQQHGDGDEHPPIVAAPRAAARIGATPDAPSDPQARGGARPYTPDPALPRRAGLSAIEPGLGAGLLAM